MSLVRWNPFREFDDMFRSYNHAMAQNPSHEGLLSADWSPSVDITEDDKEFLIKAELPEVKKKDISVDINHGVLTLSGERRSEKKDEKEHRVERFYGSFSRSFSLPDDVDEEAIKAENKDGMLYLHLPKTEREAPRKVKVDVS